MYNLNILDCLRAVNKVFLVQIYSPFSPLGLASPNESPPSLLPGSSVWLAGLLQL